MAFAVKYPRKGCPLKAAPAPRVGIRSNNCRRGYLSSHINICRQDKILIVIRDSPSQGQQISFSGNSIWAVRLACTAAVFAEGTACRKNYYDRKGNNKCCLGSYLSTSEKKC